MLSARFRQIQRYLNGALHALVERGFQASAAVAGIAATVAARFSRFERLMERFEAGALRPSRAAKAPGARATGTGRARAFPATAERLWPEHRAGWLYWVGHNNPSIAVRHRWERDPVNPGARDLGEFADRLRAMAEGDAQMQGLLGASREARRLARWFLRMGSLAALPTAVREPKRPPPARPETQAVPRPRRRRDRWAVPRPRRATHPFELPPPNLLREERERRGMWVPPPTPYPPPMTRTEQVVRLNLTHR